MANWTELVFPHTYENAVIMTQFHQDFYALMEGAAGAPKFQTAAFKAGIFTAPKIAAGAGTEPKVVVPVRFPSATRSSFFQAGAPTGWTQVTEQNDRMLRVVSGAGGGTGGAWGGGTTGSGGGHTHETNTAGAHKHQGDTGVAGKISVLTTGYTYYTYSAGGHTHDLSSAGAHTHTSLDSAWRPAYIDVVLCSKD